jgi:hypothetical protein
VDLSKLPKLSQTPAPPPNDPAEPAPAPHASQPGFPVVPVTPQPQQTWCANCHAPNPIGTRFCGNCGAELRAGAASPASVEPGVGAEVWISAIVGIVLMLIGWDFAKWALTTLFGGTYDTGFTWGAPAPGDANSHPEGSLIGYWDLAGFHALQNCALFLFGLAMVLEAIVLLVVHSRIRAKRPLLAFALTITLVATILNLVVAARLLGIGVIPLMSMLAVAFGGYIAVYEWRLYQYFQQAARRA